MVTKNIRRAPVGNYPGDCPDIRGLGKRYVATGEFRAPLKGEYYLSGAIICAYRTPNDLTTASWIAREA
jgi:hypothetical protein